MAKPSRKSRKEARKQRQEVKQEAQAKRAPVVGRTPTQKRYLHAIQHSDVTICYGPAGSGKTYIPSAYAAELIQAGQIDKIIMCRPMVEAGGEHLGALPGGVRDKMAPWTAPIMATLKDKLGAGALKTLITSGAISVVPFAYMRGLTFDRAFILFDEAQNSTVPMAKLLTGRLGEGSKLVVSGDLEQCDIHTPRCGLEAMVAAAAGAQMRGVSLVRMKTEDIVRSAMCKQWLEAWSAYDKRASELGY